jgi:uncharacterized membrane protein (DUF373 family)
LEIDLYHIEPLTLFGFSALLLALAVSYFLVERAKISAISFGGHGHEENREGLDEK